MLRIIVVGLVVLVAAMFMLPRGGGLRLQPEVATVLPEPRELPSVRFTATDGTDFSSESLAGQPTLLFFGFTNCPDICPLTLQTLATALAEIEKRNPKRAPHVAFVSVDPRRDTPARIDAYLDNFDPDFIGLSAPDAKLAPLLAALGVSVHKEEIDGQHYNVVHSGTIYVLDETGRWVAFFGGSEHKVETLVSDYLRIAYTTGAATAP